MGSSRFSASDWSTYSTSTASKSREEIFTSRTLHAELAPDKIEVRESVDSEANPKSTPIIIGCDVTGSMGMLAETIVKKDFGIIMQEIYDRKPVTDPHILCMAIGDANYDRAPLQVTQFEADIVLMKQVEKFFIEGGGGGNEGESYNLPWYFAAMKTKCDAIIKRGQKGYLFTIGDEPPLDVLRAAHIKRFIGDTAQADMTTKDLLAAVSQNWEVFHLIVKPVRDAVRRWKDLLGERAIEVSDHEKLPEVIVSTLEVLSGKDVDSVAASWSGDTAMVVRDAIGGLTKSAASAGVVRL